MNYKHLLAFYFYADGLNGALDSACVRLAVSSADHSKGCEYYAEKICALIEAKGALNELWLFLDGALSSMKERDRTALKAYADSRGKRERLAAMTAAGCDEKAVHRSLMKFSRRVSGRLRRYAEQVKVLREYYCLLRVPERQACGKAG